MVYWNIDFEKLCVHSNTHIQIEQPTKNGKLWEKNDKKMVDSWSVDFWFLYIPFNEQLQIGPHPPNHETWTHSLYETVNHSLCFEWAMKNNNNENGSTEMVLFGEGHSLFHHLPPETDMQMFNVFSSFVVVVWIPYHSPFIHSKFFIFIVATKS